MSSMASQAEAIHRNSEARSLPPNDANSLAYPRTQRRPSDRPPSTNNPATPASTAARQSLDGTSSSGNSPSQLFGGVDQLIREGQDWWLRDQNQLAVGFDNWNYNADDIASWCASQGGVGSPGFASATSPVAGSGVDGQALNGGAVGGVTNGNANNNGMLNGYGGSLSGYNESEWYQ